MTVGTAMIALIPIMWSTGVGSDVMKPLAAPMIGGLITSTIHVLVVTPILFSYMKERAFKKGELRISKNGRLGQVAMAVPGELSKKIRKGAKDAKMKLGLFFACQFPILLSILSRLRSQSFVQSRP